MFSIGTPLRALAVALLGVGLAWLWIHELAWVAVVSGLAGMALGLGLDALGRLVFLRKYPRLGLLFMEGWVLTPGVAAAAAAGVTVLVAVAFALPDDTPTETKELVGALSTGLTTFLAAAFISWVGDEKDSRVADHVRNAFRSKYDCHQEGVPPNPGVRYFKAESTGELLVYSDQTVEGWGLEGRWKRAAGIANELENHTSDP
jgi:hypothetical protein